MKCISNASGVLATITVFSFLKDADSKEACPVFEVVAGIVTLFSSSVVSGLLTTVCISITSKTFI